MEYERIIDPPMCYSSNVT